MDKSGGMDDEAVILNPAFAESEEYHDASEDTEIQKGKKCAVSRAYRAAVGGERACNPRSANVDGEILVVTKNSKTFNEQTSIGNVCTWFYSDLLPR